MQSPEIQIKYIADYLMAFLLLVLTFPIFVFVAIAIKLGDGGSVLFHRKVLGINGQSFNAFKFRTMIVDADRWLRQHPALWKKYQGNIKLRYDPRVTGIGRWLRRYSLDELPQLFNVLRGEMSLVGPRMIAPEELSKYGEYAQKRLSVKPGITGLWQVSGRQDVDYQRRIELDIEYIDNWSIWLDLKILLKTIPVVLGAKGAY